jgi:deoxyribose-phosphate aldolase
LLSLQEILRETPSYSKEDLQLIVRLIDLTALSFDDLDSDIIELVDKANKGVNGIRPAAICVYANFSATARNLLNSSIKIAVVGANFPDGQGLFETQLHQAKTLRSLPVDELDIVLNRRDIKAFETSKLIDNLRELKTAFGNKTLKVILETGSLSDKEIQFASQVSIKGGADFIKTSTGKNCEGASYQAVYLICKELIQHYHLTGKRIGIKPSGGIRKASEAYKFLYIVKSILGEEWLQPNLLRFGASSLLEDIKEQLNKR